MATAIASLPNEVPQNNVVMKVEETLNSNIILAKNSSKASN